MFQLHSCKCEITIFPLHGCYIDSQIVLGFRFHWPIIAKRSLGVDPLLIMMWVAWRDGFRSQRPSLHLTLNISALFVNYAKSNHLFGNCIYQHENDLLPDYYHTWFSEEADTLNSFWIGCLRRSWFSFPLPIATLKRSRKGNGISRLRMLSILSYLSHYNDDWVSCRVRHGHAEKKMITRQTFVR